MKALIIGGSPCSGKSTLSQHLAEKTGGQVIRVDDFMGDHIQEADEKLQPIMYKWRSQPWHELFSRPVDIQLQEEIRFYEEEWPLLKRDIHKAVNSDFVIVEGCGVMPEFAKDLFEEVHVFYMVATEAFQREKYALRTWAYDLLKDARDVNLAFDRWMERDIAFAKHIHKTAVDLAYPVHVTDGVTSVTQVAEMLVDLFKL